MKLVPLTWVVVGLAAPVAAQSCFEPDPALTVGDSPVGITLADGDGDGDLDLVTLENSTSARRVVVRWNDGTGAWNSPTTFDVGFNPWDAEFADVDGDGDPDLLYTNGEPAHTLTVRRNLGGHAFGPAQTYVVSLVPEQIECGDLDNDGDVDLVVMCTGAALGGTGVLMTLHNDGSGNFVSGGGLIAGPARVAVADYDVDGDLDVITIRPMSTTVFVSRNDGHGAFPGTPSTILLSSEPYDVAAADVDGDGRPDAIFTQSGGKFSVVRSVPGPGFAAPVEYTTTVALARLDVADFDLDGDVDVALVFGLTGTIRTYENLGGGVFQSDFAYGVPTFPIGHARGDVDGDGDTDLAYAVPTHDAVHVLRNCAWSGVPTCFGDGTATACPCGNASAVGARAGCLHSLGAGGTLRASGSASLTLDSIVLRGASMPNAPALYFQGTSAANGGLGSVFGDGLRCAGGTIRRLGIATNIGGASQFPGAGQLPVSVVGAVTAPGDRHYQVWFRNAASFCTSATFNLTNSLSLVWRP